MNTHRLIQLARSISENLEHNWKHVSFILDKNTPVSVGWNKPFKTHPLAYKRGYRYSAIHSEVSAIVSYDGNIKDFRKLKLINIRIDKFGNIKNSKPCRICQTLLLSFGFKEVWYTNSYGDFEVWQCS